jgi:hypothetical protein
MIDKRIENLQIELKNLVIENETIKNKFLYDSFELLPDIGNIVYRIDIGENNLTLRFDFSNRCEVIYEFYKPNSELKMTTRGDGNIHNRLNADDYANFLKLNRYICDEWLTVLKNGDSPFIKLIKDFHHTLVQISRAETHTKKTLQELFHEKKKVEFNNFFDGLKDGDKIIFNQPLRINFSSGSTKNEYRLTSLILWKRTNKLIKVRLPYLDPNMTSQVNTNIYRNRVGIPTNNFKSVKKHVLHRELFHEYLNDNINMVTTNKHNSLKMLVDKL